MSEQLFPLRLASGDRFCNRNSERKLLKEFIKQKRPTALISPRRYGKTSLAYKATKESKLPLCTIDFLTAYDDESVCLTIIRSISDLISKILPIDMKTIALLEKCFRGIKAAIRYKSIELEFTTSTTRLDPIRQMFETLQGLEKLASKLNKTVVIFMDEFQRILELEKNISIQGSIRHVAQSTKHIAFLFSGSSRHMLSQAFDDPDQPLYMMCEKIFLDRIETEAYIPYIQAAAEIQWQKKLPQELVLRIIQLSENHPFYVNYLCSRLWQNNKPPKNIEDIEEGWYQCLLSEERRFIEILEKQPLNQRVLLKAIAQTPELKKPTGSAFLNKIHITSGSATPALKTLRKKDLIYIDEQNTTRVLDPLMKYFLCGTITQ